MADDPLPKVTEINAIGRDRRQLLITWSPGTGKLSLEGSSAGRRAHCQKNNVVRLV